MRWILQNAMIKDILADSVCRAMRELFNQRLEPEAIQVQLTRKDFEGDFTIVTFPLSRYSGKNPLETGQALGEWMVEDLDAVESFNIVKGFLNLKLADSWWNAFLKRNYGEKDFGYSPQLETSPVVIEYSSPNTNKPLHLGHIRNNLLGWSIAEILRASGQPVLRVNLVNDRGIHICKSMLAWQLWGEGETPESSGIKGDHLVGKYYVKFDQEYKAEVKEMVKNGTLEEQAQQKAPLILKARQMLQRWEAMDDDVFALWKMMNGWVYSGFEETYKRLGIQFEKTYYESDTWVLGKELVIQGLNDGILFKKEDGSIWADLSDEGMDEKLLLRADGTSVYMTQDLGTARQREEEFKPSQLLYVVGNEQEYHFKVLSLVLKKLGYKWADKIHHLSYGMVELPHGKMKSREGTVVDADDLMDEMQRTAQAMTEELGKSDGLSEEEKSELYRMIGMGALKFFILKVDPKKKMLFNPEESVDFNGHTGPFIQYTHARIRSLLRKASTREHNWEEDCKEYRLLPKERQLLVKLHEFPETIKSAAASYSPALMANYAYELAQEYNGFYQEIKVLSEAEDAARCFRLKMSEMVSNVLKSAMDLLGVDVPEQM